MTSLLISQLRALAKNYHDDHSLGDQAADEIERLRAALDTSERERVELTKDKYTLAAGMESLRDELAQKNAVINDLITGQNNLFNENEGLAELNRTLINAARDDCENIAKLRAELEQKTGEATYWQNMLEKATRNYAAIVLANQQTNTDNAALRSLCAAKPKNIGVILLCTAAEAFEAKEWLADVDAAGRGEGER